MTWVKQISTISTIKTNANKILCDKAFNTAKNPKYN